MCCSRRRAGLLLSPPCCRFSVDVSMIACPAGVLCVCTDRTVRTSVVAVARALVLFCVPCAGWLVVFWLRVAMRRTLWMDTERCVRRLLDCPVVDAVAVLCCAAVLFPRVCYLCALSVVTLNTSISCNFINRLQQHAVINYQNSLRTAKRYRASFASQTWLVLYLRACDVYNGLVSAAPCESGRGSER